MFKFCKNKKGESQLRDSNSLYEPLKIANDLSILPSEVIKVLQLISPDIKHSEDFADELERVILSDPVLTAKVLHIANLTFGNVLGPISKITQAISLLGVTAIKSVILSTPLLDVYKKGGPGILVDRLQLAHHCLGTAVCSSMISEASDFFDHETAFIAGLLHDIGKVIISENNEPEFQKIRELVKSEKYTVLEAEKEILGTDHAYIGYAFLTELQLPESIRYAVKYHHLSLTSKEYPVLEHEAKYHLDLIRIVSLSNKVCKINQIGSSGDISKLDLHDADWQSLPIPQSVADNIKINLKQETAKLAEHLKINVPDTEIPRIESLTRQELGKITLELEQTKRKLETAVKKISDLQVYTRNILDNMPNGLISTDESGMIETLNKEAENIFGLYEGTVKGFHYSVFPELASIKSILEDAQKRQIIYDRKEVSFQKPNGDTRLLLVSTSFLRQYASPPIGIILIVRDITQAREMEIKMMRSDQLALIGKMTAGIIHEIKNPLTSISGLLEMSMLDKIENEKTSERLRMISNEIKRISKMTSNLVSFARQSQPAFENFSINDCILETLGLMEYQIRSSKIEIKTTMHENIPNVFADRQQMTQVTINLVQNAIDAMPKGGTLFIETSKTTFTDEDVNLLKMSKHLANNLDYLPNENEKEVYFKQNDKAIAVKIRDIGIGIPDDISPYIFSSFFTTKQPGKGTGLGLVVSYEIIKKHQGIITYKSESGKGTEFTFKLPIRTQR